MNKMRTVALLLSIPLCWAADSVPADSSGNGLLAGKYWVREVVPLAFVAFTGAMTFDGKGNYTFTGQLLEQTGDTSHKTKVSQVTVNGTYSVGATGIVSIDNLTRSADYLFASSGSTLLLGGMGSSGVIVASAAEADYNDLFLAIPAGTAIQNSALAGAYWVGHLDYGTVQPPTGYPVTGRNSLFQINADGKGGFADVTITGHDVAQKDLQLTQTVRSATYNFNADASATLNFPGPVGVSSSLGIFTGTKTLYLSADGNYVLGGDPNGYDIFFGFRPLSASTAVSDVYFGVYYFAGITSDWSDPAYPLFESFYGSINAFKGLNGYYHKRSNPFNDLQYDFNFESGNGTLSSAGVLEGDARTVVGVGGKIVMSVGTGTNYFLSVNSLAANPTLSGVFLNPLGILNAASYSPVTSGVSPGELLTIYGSNLSDFSGTSAIPFPPSLKGVQVMINDRPAAVYAVSAGQLSVIVPFATSGDWAKIQVNNNGKLSNIVTLFNRACSPGVFTSSAGGDGNAAVLHADYSVVNASNPAKQGEIVAIYTTGLGVVSPTVADGAAGPRSPLSTIATGAVYFGNSTGVIYYKGLAPDLAGLYQVNVQIPTDAPIGNILLEIDSGPNLSCVGRQATIPIVKGP